MKTLAPTWLEISHPNGRPYTEQQIRYVQEQLEASGKDLGDLQASDIKPLSEQALQKYPAIIH